MAAKPMPRICAGMSGNRVMSVPNSNHLLASGLANNSLPSPETPNKANHIPMQVNACAAHLPAVVEGNKTDVTKSQYDDLGVQNQFDKQGDIHTPGTNSVSSLVSKQINNSDLPVPMPGTLSTDTDNAESDVQRCKELMMLQVCFIMDVFILANNLHHVNISSF